MQISACKILYRQYINKLHNATLKILSIIHWKKSNQLWGNNWITLYSLILRSSWWQQDRHWWDTAVLWRPGSGPSQYKCPPHSLEVQGSNTVRVFKTGVHGWHGRTGVRMYFQINNPETSPLFSVSGLHHQTHKASTLYIIFYLHIVCSKKCLLV